MQPDAGDISVEVSLTSDRCRNIAIVRAGVDWPQAMDPYSEFIYVKVDKAGDDGKVNEGAYMLLQEHTLEKI